VFAANSTRTGIVSVLIIAALSVAGAAAGGRGDSRDKVRPSEPSNVGLQAATTSGVTLQWTASTDNVGVAAYLVYIDGGQRARVTNTSYSAWGLDCGSSVGVWIVAVDAANNRSSRATAVVATASCPDLQAPSTPSGFRQDATTQSSVVLAWNPSSDNVGVVSYGIYEGGFLVKSVSSPNTTFAGLPCGTTRGYEIDASDAAGNRSARGRVWIRTADCGDSEPPSVPTDLVAESTETTVSERLR
jgi:chitodextrinase